MQDHEIELKFPISDPRSPPIAPPSARLPPRHPRTFEHNTLYDTPTRDLRAKRQLLRIRQYGPLCTVTHKRIADQENAAESTRYKIRIETETTVADGSRSRRHLPAARLHPAFTYEKYRTEWSHADPITNYRTHLVIDETPIGNYAELEGPPDWIDRTLAELDIDPATCLTDSYGKLFLDWKQRTGSPAENLTFAEIFTPALATR